MLDAQVGLDVEVAGAAFGEEAADVVFGVRVGGGGDADAVGTFEIVAGGEVAAGPFDEPLQDAGAFVADEFEGQVVDLAVVGDGALEGSKRMRRQKAKPRWRLRGGGCRAATGGGWG